MSALNSVTARRRTLRLWQVVAVALAIATLAFAMWTLSARANGFAVSFTPVGNVAGTANADYAISFSSANGAAAAIEVTFPAGYVLEDPTNVGINAGSCGASIGSVGEICVAGGLGTAGVTPSVDGQTITLTFASHNTPYDLTSGFTTFTITAGITNPTLAGVKPKAGFTVATVGGNAESPRASGVDVTIVAGVPDRIALTGPASVVAGLTSTDFTITVQDQFENPTDVGQDTAFGLGGQDAGTATFTPMSPATVPNGQSSVTFTYAQTVAGAKGVGASWSTGGADLGSATHNITVSPGAYSATHSTVAVTGDATITYPGATTATLIARDAFANPITDLTLNLVQFSHSGGSAAGTFALATHLGAGVYQSTFTGTSAGTATTIAATYNGGAPAALGGSPTITVARLALTVTGITAADKVYDGNTTATLVGSGTLSGVIGGDDVTLGGTAAGTFDSANVGTGKTVTVSGLTLGGADAGNYTLTQPTTTASITAVVEEEPAATPTPIPTPAPGSGEPVVTKSDEHISTPAVAGEGSSVQTQTTSGATATVNAPANALPDGSTLSAASLNNLAELTSQAPAPAGTTVALAFVLEATDTNGNRLTQFDPSLELEFNVPASSVPAGATSGQMVVAFWNGSSWTEVEALVIVNSDGSFTITASVDHFTVFALLHQPDRGTFSSALSFPVTFTVWRGGGYSLLDTAVGHGGSAWLMVNGRFYAYTVGVPAFVNATFVSMFPAGIASNTAVVVARPD